MFSRRLYNLSKQLILTSDARQRKAEEAEELHDRHVMSTTGHFLLNFFPRAFIGTESLIFHVYIVTFLVLMF